jgi:hypothetical protein
MTWQSVDERSVRLRAFRRPPSNRDGFYSNDQACRLAFEPIVTARMRGAKSIPIVEMTVIFVAPYTREEMIVTTLWRGIASALILLGAVAMVAATESRDSGWRYRRVLDLLGTDVAVCAKGTVEQRLDCLGRQIDELSRRLEKPRVIPL